MTRLGRCSLLVLLVASATHALAQETRLAWPRWSPLSPRAELLRAMPSAHQTLESPWEPRPPFGAFLLTGNPALLAWESAGRRSDYSVQSDGESGDYRRPLDPQRVSTLLAGASGHSQMTRGGVIGGILAGETRFAPGPRGDQSQPHGSSPLVLADTSADRMQSTSVRMHGSGGWTIARWALGISGAYDTRRRNTEDAGFVRQTQVTTPGVMVGAARRVGTPLQLEIGVHAGHQRLAETSEFRERATQGRLFQLQGFRDVLPTDVDQDFYQRLDERASFAGIALAGNVTETRWVIGVEKSARREATSYAQSALARFDRWRADGLRFDAGAERAFGHHTVRARVHSSHVKGSVRLAVDSSGPSLRSRERSTMVRFDYETRIGVKAAGHFVVAATDNRLVREDTASGVLLNLLWRDPGASATFTYQVTSPLSVLLGVSRYWHRATGTVPRPQDRGSGYLRFVAPEMAIYAGPATASAFQAGLRWAFSPALSAMLTGRTGSVAPEPYIVLTDRPTGRRTAHELTFRLTFIPEEE